MKPEAPRSPAGTSKLADQPREDELESSSGAIPDEPPPEGATQAFGSQDTRANPKDAPDPNATQAPRQDGAAPIPPPHGSGAASGTSRGAAKGKLSALGDFRLVKKIGSGGMGQVFKGRQISLDRDVAVKVLSRQLAGDPSFVERFNREARIMARLDHPHIVRCFGIGEEHGWHYLAMEFLDGGSVQDWLKKLGRFSLGDAVHIVLAAAAGLQHAHEQGMIHRDIKPDNILLTGKGLVKIADLGLAKALAEDLSLTKTGTGAGTPYYMAPEQASNAKKVDGRADIYSLGVMLYCFLTGQLPFQGDSALELIQAKEKGKYTPAKRGNPDIPDQLDLIIDKMLATNPNHRYPTCAELILDLERLKLAHPTLSFFEKEAAPDGPRGSTPGSTTRPGAARPTMPGARPQSASSQPSDPESAEAPLEFWYIAYKTPQGKVVTRKMREPEVMQLIDEEHFDWGNTQASRSLKGNYRDLATFREFEKAVRARMTRAKTKRRGVSLQDAYQKIEEEQAQEKRWRWFRKMTQSLWGWVVLLLWLGVIAFAGYLLILGGNHLVIWIGDKLKEIGW